MGCRSRLLDRHMNRKFPVQSIEGKSPINELHVRLQKTPYIEKPQQSTGCCKTPTCMGLYEDDTDTMPFTEIG